MTEHHPITTRIPDDRPVAGLEYGATVTASDRSWSGYWVRPGDSGELPFRVALLTPYADELPDSDRELVEDIKAEIIESLTVAEHVAVAFLQDDQRRHHPITGEHLWDHCREREGEIDQEWDAMRFIFPDGSALIDSATSWAIDLSQVRAGEADEV